MWWIRDYIHLHLLPQGWSRRKFRLCSLESWILGNSFCIWCEIQWFAYWASDFEFIHHLIRVFFIICLCKTSFIILFSGVRANIPSCFNLFAIVERELFDRVFVKQWIQVVPLNGMNDFAVHCSVQFNGTWQEGCHVWHNLDNIICKCLPIWLA